MISVALITSGGNDKKRDPAERVSNDSSPFAFSTAEQSIQLLVSLMPPGGAENKLFSERGIAFCSALMPALREAHDAGVLLISPGIIRSFMGYRDFCALAGYYDPNNTFHAKIYKCLSPATIETVKSFIKSCSGFDEKKPLNKQPDEVSRQFGFAQAYFTRVISSLTDTYGHIYMTGRGEVEDRDCILQNRIKVVMLPALEKSGEELANLGKINLSSTRNAMSVGLGDGIEGEKEDVLDSLPTASLVPYKVILDEIAFQLVQGIAVTAAQGRGLSFAFTFGGQDYAGIVKADENEAEQLIANTRKKYFMILEDGGKTLQLIKSVAGAAQVAVNKGFSRKNSWGYTPDIDAQMQAFDRVDHMDLRRFSEGEALLFFKDSIIPINTFFHGLGKKDLIQSVLVNRMAKTELPTEGIGAQLIDPAFTQLMKDIDDWRRAFNDEYATAASPVPDDAMSESLIRLLDMPEDVWGNRQPARIVTEALLKDVDEEAELDDSDDYGMEDASLMDDLIAGAGAQHYLDDDEIAAMAVDIQNDIDSVGTRVTSANDNPVEFSRMETKGTNFLVNAAAQHPWLWGNARQVQTAAEDITDIEQFLGATKEQATQAAQKTVDAVICGTHYPNSPAPLNDQASAEKALGYLHQWIDSPSKEVTDDEETA